MRDEERQRREAQSGAKLRAAMAKSEAAKLGIQRCRKCQGRVKPQRDARVCQTCGRRYKLSSSPRRGV